MKIRKVITAILMSFIVSQADAIYDKSINYMVTDVASKFTSDPNEIKRFMKNILGQGEFKLVNHQQYINTLGLKDKAGGDYTIEERKKQAYFFMSTYAFFFGAMCAKEYDGKAKYLAANRIFANLKTPKDINKEQFEYHVNTVKNFVKMGMYIYEEIYERNNKALFWWKDGHFLETVWSLKDIFLSNSSRNISRINEKYAQLGKNMNDWAITASALVHSNKIQELHGDLNWKLNFENFLYHNLKDLGNIVINALERNTVISYKPKTSKSADNFIKNQIKKNVDAKPSLPSKKMNPTKAKKELEELAAQPKMKEALQEYKKFITETAANKPETSGSSISTNKTHTDKKSDISPKLGQKVKNMVNTDPDATSIKIDKTSKGSKLNITGGKSGFLSDLKGFNKSNLKDNKTPQTLKPVDPSVGNALSILQDALKNRRNAIIDEDDWEDDYESNKEVDSIHKSSSSTTIKNLTTNKPTSQTIKSTLNAPKPPKLNPGSSPPPPPKSPTLLKKNVSSTHNEDVDLLTLILGKMGNMKSGQEIAEQVNTEQLSKQQKKKSDNILEKILTQAIEKTKLLENQEDASNDDNWDDSDSENDWDDDEWDD